MTEVQLLCASEKELETYRKPSLYRNLSSFTLAVLLLNPFQTQSGNEAVAIHFSFSSSPPEEETAYIFFLKHKCCNTNKCFASVFFECHFSYVISSKTQNVTQESVLFFYSDSGICPSHAACRPYVEFPLYWVTNIWPVSLPSLICSGVIVAFQSNTCRPQAERMIKNTLDDHLKVFFSKKKKEDIFTQVPNI